ncbi:hypothetical protein GWO43_03935, partial [candidate division KSB1 bacterium]|nr:hypothetical protein [candidate division KSB1 bacterium]NIX69733.1 hypothetical protein [candidate division KSB1 bacterium]
MAFKTRKFQTIFWSALFILMSFNSVEPKLQEKAHMKFRSLTPNVMVEDVNETVEYYKDKLGFELIMSVPEEG